MLIVIFHLAPMYMIDQLSDWFTLHYLVCGGWLSSINLIRPASSLMQLVFTIAIYTSNGVVLMAASWIAVLGGSIGSIYIVLMCNQLVVAYILYWTTGAINWWPPLVQKWWLHIGLLSYYWWFYDTSDVCCDCFTT